MLTAEQSRIFPITQLGVSWPPLAPEKEKVGAADCIHNENQCLLLLPALVTAIAALVTALPALAIFALATLAMLLVVDNDTSDNSSSNCSNGSTDDDALLLSHL